MLIGIDVDESSWSQMRARVPAMKPAWAWSSSSCAFAAADFVALASLDIDLTGLNANHGSISSGVLQEEVSNIRRIQEKLYR
ncbi:hypothetical protein [Streptomyces sp. NPDC047000]|uniref:hypothetical protein n=1 Tax=Streptomyces sp. NPDC047000 TaxID=3155474 RepID=UPI0033ED775F